MLCVTDEIERILQQVLGPVEVPAAGSSSDFAVDTARVLMKLGRSWPSDPSRDSRRDLDRICHKLAVSGRLLAGYDRDWKPTSDRRELPDRYRPAVAAILLAYSETLADSQRGWSLKLLNAALRVLERAPALPDSLRSRVDLRLLAVAVPEPLPERPNQTERAPAAEEWAGSEEDCLGRPRIERPIRTLPLTVLAYEGPCARAYLATMRRANLRPTRILLVVLSDHPRSGKPVGRRLPGRMRSWYAEKLQACSLNHWPKRIRQTRPDFVRRITAGLQPIISSPDELVDEMYRPFSYERYADRVDRIFARDLRNDAVRDALGDDATPLVLFTGGGILPGRFIDLPGKRFLHVHPGHLPDVRGADGLLWSMLVRGRPSMSFFYLAAGLDTGDVVEVHDYPPLTFVDPNGHTSAGHFRPEHRPDDQTLYRAIFSYVDPLLRADLLVRGVLARSQDLTGLSAVRQPAGQGVTYPFMHDRLRHIVLDHLFPRT